MSDARAGFKPSRCVCDSNGSRKHNTREEPPLEGHPTTGCQPVSPSRILYRFFSSGVQRVCGRLATASSRRRGQRHDHTMQDHTDGEEHHTKSDTSGCVGGASGVPPTQLPAVERLYSGKTAVQLLASGTSGVYRCHARARTRTPARGHTYARLRKVGIPPTSPTRVGGTRRSYQNAEVSE